MSMAYPSQKEIERDPRLKDGSRSDSEKKAEPEPRVLEGEGLSTSRAGSRELPTCCPQSPLWGEQGQKLPLTLQTG